MGHINQALATGREILALERELFGMQSNDPARAGLGQRHTALMRQQQDEMLAAVHAGADWDTIRFALELHGQDANRQMPPTGPTPAETLLQLMRQYGAEPVVEALIAATDAQPAG